MLGVTVGVTIKDSDWEQRRHLPADNVLLFDLGSVFEVCLVCERSFSRPRMTCAHTLIPTGRNCDCPSLQGGAREGPL